MLTFDNLRAYFQHLQTSNSARNRSYDHKTVRLVTRCLSIVVRAMVCGRDPGPGETEEAVKAAGERLIKRLQAMGRSVQEALALQGRELRVAEVLQQPQAPRSITSCRCACQPSLL